MGRLVSGRWDSSENTLENGRYIRHFNTISNSKILSEKLGLIHDRRRLLLILSHSCPWSHRVALVRSLKRLYEIPVHYAHGPRLEGYALNGGGKLRVPGVAAPLVHLHELYTAHDPSYTGRVTVPVLWDSLEGSILSNESKHLMITLDRVPSRLSVPYSLYPAALETEVSRWSSWLYTQFNNAVYQAGFARSQSAYDEAEECVFDALALLDAHLSRNRFLCGDVFTGADVQALPTLVRFDRVYHILFRCARRRLTDHRHVWDYARELFALPRVAATVDWDAMAHASYAVDDDSERAGIIPRAPAADWLAPSGRQDVGTALVLDADQQAHPLTEALGS